LTNLKPRYFNLSLGDVHIYGLHEESVLKQIERIPYTFPQINLPNFTTLEDIEKLTYKDFTIEKYNYYDSIKAPMVA
jgi:thymidylate synthase